MKTRSSIEHGAVGGTCGREGVLGVILSDVKPRRLKLLVLCLCGVVTLGAGCVPFGTALSKAVKIDYDQSMVFDKFRFSKPVKAPEGMWEGLHSDAGAWLVYNICLVDNSGSAAADFELDLSKFYVEIDSHAYYYKKMTMPQYSVDPFVWGASIDDDAIWAHFTNDVQLGDDTKAIGAHATYSEPTRVGIYVPSFGPAPVKHADKVAEYELEYDGPVLLKDRGQTPDDKTIGNNAVVHADLPTVCRPPTK